MFSEPVPVPARRMIPVERARGAWTLGGLPGRFLSPAELCGLVADLALRPEPWQQRVAFSDEKRHYASLHRDDHVDVWLLCWTPANDTGWHDHDVSSFAVAVVRGVLVEHNPTSGGRSLRTEVAAGHVYGAGPEHIHRLTGKARESVSIHAYSPPLWRMGQYAMTGGVLRRISVSYADELRPVGDFANSSH
ncbi:cysteine dioxygenase family protein [Saccharopolyspora indica]|uniref:cysteine dioxygenase n=1 Tax=Saccharopolyspora indica TaxID=1229659 RepID=UPI0022EA3DB2|nr:cysteine dioxygenase family protein [Saccharopolyspora indica]MDA3645718.1 cysteine dioxygenase family protein [Saccharopolyspora indica]